ncbi:hypothetical protein BHU72_14645 [Desulfuribacillus stibiiarsenatis]|uniref:HTH cro/C1-type domain-containing protein n=1 Tax=Desulfuribacillus stibiiarsenatis TaxID=1390249 RepID=A0A1E5L7E6_9FIRM|nr:helix-turn-helix transcriptional regulator [Desulfuribacillus stibiiarsenatis]OEH86065.1 hypothetical protein BHU72_14645 [Desulfuribacillus stibiiarsenatis]
MSNVNENVEKIRIAKGVSKTHMAKRLGYKTIQGYKHLASGSTKYTAERIMIAADTLQVNVQVFYDNKLTETVITEYSRTTA